MAEIKLGRWGELVHSGHKWEQTAAAMFLQPAINVLVRTAEIMLLVGAFQAAATATGNVTIEVLAGVMYAVLGAHLVTVFFQYVVFPLNRAVRIRGTFLNLVLVLIFGGATVCLYLFLADQIAKASKQLVLVV